MENSNAMGQTNVCKCPHHMMIPCLIVVFGLVFLLGAFGVLGERVVGVTWPIIVVVAGLQKMMERNCKCC